MPTRLDLLILGPITHYGSYEETCGSDFSAGLFVEFLAEVVDEDTGAPYEIPVYAKVTRNGEQLCSLSTGASRSVWDDEPPIAMEVSDAPVAETIQQLVAAGIDFVVDHEWASSPGVSLPEEATPHTDVTARPRSVFRSRRRRSRMPAATTDPYFTLEFDSETMASEVLFAHETPGPSSVDMAAQEEILKTIEETHDECRKLL